MQTQCTAEGVSLEPHFRRQVETTFDGGLVTSDGGALLLRAVESRVGVIERMARCFQDFRAQKRIEFTVKELLAQRVFGLALGYEDLDGHDRLRLDPVLGLAVGRKDVLG